MHSCIGCSSYTIFPNVSIQRCSECETYVHIIDQKSYFVPYLEENNDKFTISCWHGSGINFIQHINGSPHNGYLRTRIKVMLRLLQLEIPGRLTKKAVQGLFFNLKEKITQYGLAISMLNKENKPINTNKSFLEEPCILTLVNNEKPRPDLGNIHDESTIKNKTNGLSRDSSSWILQTLEQLYPKQVLYPKQKEAIIAAIENPGNVTSVVIPTGSGKTRISQSLVMHLRIQNTDQQPKNGPVIILYPTISLLDDQKSEWDKLNKDLESIGENKIAFRILHSREKKRLEESGDEFDYAELLNGKLDVILCSPESLVPNKGGISLLEIGMRLSNHETEKPFSALIIDETHIIKDWGDSIRDAYLLIPSFQRLLKRINPSFRTLLLSATLSPREEEDIISNSLKIGRDQVSKIRSKDIRKDLAYSVIEKEENWEKIIDETLNEFFNHNKWRNWKEKDRHAPLLIYTFRIEDCKQYANYIASKGHLVETYHGKTSNRQTILNKFQQNKIHVLVATSAFGMGVNKKDVWMIVYIGEPKTLRELYQAFGRAARGSNWYRDKGRKRNGNCILRHVKNRKIPYAPTILSDKGLERFLASLDGKKLTDNGFLLMKMHSNQNIYWNPFDKSDYFEEKKSEIDSDLSEQEINQILEENYHKSIAMRKNKEYGKRRKALIYLEAADAITIHGIVPMNPVTDPELNLVSILEEGGINNLIEVYSKIGWKSLTYNTNSELYMICQMNKQINTFDDFINLYEEGVDQFRADYDDSSKELKVFLKDKGRCIRQRFAPLIGITPSEYTSCIEQFEHNKSNPDLSNDIIIPCSVCRQKMFSETDLFNFNVNLGFKNKPPYTIWAEEEDLDYLSGNTFKKEIDELRFDSTIESLPVNGYICGFLCEGHIDEFNTNLYHQNKDVWFELCQLRTIKSNNMIINFDEIYSKNGDLLQSEYVSIIINLISMSVVIDVKIMMPTNEFEYGGVIYWNEDKLICRMIGSEKEALKLYNKIHNSCKNDLKYRFIGKYKPDIHGDNIRREWP